MRNLRSILLSASGFLAIAFLAAGCGGGSGGPSVGTASLRGAVVMVDGQTTNLSGIRLVDTRTGRRVTTGAGGAFDFGTVPAGVITLRLGNGVMAEAAPGDDAEDPSEDPAGDGPENEAGEDEGDGENNDVTDDADDEDVGDDDMDVGNVDDGEVVEIELTIEANRIHTADIAKTGDDHRQAAVELIRSIDSDDADVVGLARVDSSATGDGLRVAAEHVDAGRVLELFVLDLTGVAESQGMATADGTGRAAWKLSSAMGGRLPFGTASAAGLEGFTVEVRDALTGTVLLYGQLPALPAAVEPHAPPV